MTDPSPTRRPKTQTRREKVNKMRKRIPTISVIVLLLIIGVIIASQALFIVDETKQAIILQLGEPINTVQTPGLNTKLPFFQNVIYFEKRVLSSDAPPQEYLTSDKKRLVVDHVTRWQIRILSSFLKPSEQKRELEPA